MSQSSVQSTIFNLRHTPTTTGLRRQSLHVNPLSQFELWLEEALAANLHQPNAMTLATSTKDGIPSARIVLLRSYDAQGFVFYTNYHSQKGRELEENPHAALVFYWDSLSRQVRITGQVNRVTNKESDSYFQSRPPLSQLSACASPQSQIIANRAILEDAWQAIEQQFEEKNAPVDRPEFWGGYRVAPTTIEFWQSGPNRLHDRFIYTRQTNNDWHINRLAP